MISVIKTAIITIIISFVSGLLLEYCKNLAPKILCNIGNGIPIEINNKKVYAYIITVSNLSNKIIHELNLNIQSLQSNLKIADAKITKGLKFDSSIKDNILDIYIPFLSKGDKFSVTVYVENYNKPVIIMRSPENFKQIDSVEQKGVISSLVNIPGNINGAIWKMVGKDETAVSNKKSEILHRNKKFGKDKKRAIIIVSIILVMIVGGIVKFYFKGMSTNAQTSNMKTNVHKKSTDASESAGETTKNTDEKASTDGTTKNTGTKTSTSGTTGNTDTKTSIDGINRNTDANTSTNGTTGNADTKESTSGTTGNTGAKAPTDGTTQNTDTKTSTDGTTQNTDTKTSTNGTTGSH